MLDKRCRLALNGIASRLVTVFASLQIALNACFAEFGEAHGGKGKSDFDKVVTRHSDGTQYLVFTPGKLAQHRGCLFGILGFAKNLPIQRDDGVGGQHRMRR